MKKLKNQIRKSLNLSLTERKNKHYNWKFLSHAKSIVGQIVPQVNPCCFRHKSPKSSDWLYSRGESKTLRSGKENNKA